MFFCDEAVNDGLDVIAVTETTAEEAVATATDTYKYVFRNVQGKNNWYFCEFGDYTEKELSYIDGQWRGADETAYIGRGVFRPGYTSDVGVKYVAHKNGRIRLNGVVSAKEDECSRGNGVIAEIYHGSKMIWRSTVTHEKEASYDFTLPVKKGEEISFRINNNGNFSYDWTSWEPVVEYINNSYSFSMDEYSYYQKNTDDLSKQSLKYNGLTHKFEGSGVYFDGDYISHNEGFSAVKAYTALREGRYRIRGIMNEAHNRDVTVSVRKNGEEIWKQMFPAGETGRVDIRAYLFGEDTVETEVVIDNPEADNPVQLDIDVERIIGTMYCDNSMSSGYTYEVTDKYLLSELVGTSQGENGMRYYFIHKDKEYAMEYNPSSKRWENTDSSSGGYISKTSGYSGMYTDTVMEWSVPKEGILHIDGNMFVYDRKDGTLCRIYKNDEVIWSNRVGGERLVRWDEPYDTSYFSGEVNVVTPVNVGDKITFFFDQWRMADDDPAVFSDVTISYIKGSVLSETTKWKIDKSIVLDAEKKEIHKNGNVIEADIRKEDGDIYISSVTANEVFGTVYADNEYILLGDVVSNTNKNLVETENGLAIVYDGLPMRFGYAELGEINTMVNPGINVDKPVMYWVEDKDGNKAEGSIQKGAEYFVKLEAENYLGRDVDLKLMLAEYSADDILLNIELLADREIKVGTKYTSDENTGFEVGEDISYVKIFVLDGFERINSLAETVRFDVVNQ